MNVTRLNPTIISFTHPKKDFMLGPAGGSAINKVRLREEMHSKFFDLEAKELVMGSCPARAIASVCTNFKPYSAAIHESYRGCSRSRASGAGKAEAREGGVQSKSREVQGRSRGVKQGQGPRKNCFSRRSLGGLAR